MKFQRRFMVLIPVFLLLSHSGCRHMDTITQNSAETQEAHRDLSLRPRSYALPTNRVFDTARTLVNTLPRWRAVEQDPSSGTILAKRQTRLFKFVDDVRIEISPTETGDTTVRVFSQSRVGKWDFGQNARNIRTFLNALDEKIKSM